MSRKTHNGIYDLVVIGGGSAGLVAAAGAALLGARTALVERRALGGDCLFTGCVPSKTLISSARWAHEARRAESFGFRLFEPQFANDDFRSIIRRVQHVIAEVGERDSVKRFEEMGVEIIFGTPRFINPRELCVTQHGAGGASNSASDDERRLHARRFCIATGSRPLIPAVEGLENVGYLTNENIFDLDELPKNLAIIGGGPIACELGQCFRRFGSRVTIFEHGERLLSKEDEEVSDFITARLRAEGIVVRTSTEVMRVEAQDEMKRLTLKTAHGDETLDTDALLIASGRRPNTESLDLERAGVTYDERRIKTDSYLRTTARHIYAAGDCTGHFQFTHLAAYEASVVVRNALFFPGVRRRVDFRVVPWATFTDPELARVGLTEREAREEYGGGNVRVYRAEYEENDRASTEGTTAGFAKIICAGWRDRIVGASIVGAHAGESIHEVVLAMKQRLPVTALSSLIHVYPTLTQIVQQAGLNAVLANFASYRQLLKRYFAIWRKF